MDWLILARAPFALALAAAIAVGALAFGVPPVVAAILGAFAGTLAWRTEPAPVPAPQPPREPALPIGVDELIEAIGDPVLLIEGQIVTRANSPARALLGQHILGGDVRLAIRHPAAAERLTMSDTPDSSPIELVGLGTRERRWEMVVQPLGNGARLVRLGDRTGAYAIERMRVDFVANASHELRTPLATLLGYIETLEDAGDDAPTRARFLKIMFGEAKRMQRLVEDLMSLSRIEAERYSVPQTPVSLPQLVEEVRAALRTNLVAEAGRIVVAVADDLPPVPGDRAQLSQLLHNVIGNAAKYGRPGTPIHVTLDTTGGLVRLVVEDEGDGIAAEHLPRLTERFYRVDASRSRALGGTGLGLSIVKHIVERHRGRLDISSVVGRGTRIAVLLPAAEALSSNRHVNVTRKQSNQPSDGAAAAGRD